MATPAAAPRPSVPAPRRSRLALARARHRSLLRRRTDRRRSAVVELQVLACLAAAALCALLGLSVYQHGQAHSLQQARQLRPVQARLVGAPYASGVGGYLAQVSWTAPGGKARQGVAAVPAADQVGDRTPIWLDASGDPAAAPASSQDNAGTAVLTGLLTLVCAWSVVVAAGAVARTRLDRSDERAWASEWQVYEPLWTRGAGDR
ncbi:Rv1733c family protein [Streptacidiphilus jiangxiensis]|uniref:Uncharacterized protein n=1 Tax=Streptacidiphilus jiangxiensis TaxID=235985 RepID=A0A1H7QS10_STRJI|nr:hypothetical protein [Streptacidiphilus jiangxiensis]SEL50756.1 hypothetical protein SAMN05414137_109185 [Streptacidiphilus jiangxiensis]